MEQVHESDIDRLLRQLDLFAHGSFSVEDLPGGLTNRNLKVTNDNGSYVVRISSENSGQLSINRDVEFENSKAAADAGVGAPVLDYRPDLGVLVVGFLEATTCTPQDLRDETRLRAIAQACQQLHQGPRFVNSFNMFELQPFYLSIVKAQGYRLPDRYQEFADHMDRIQAALSENAGATVPCNNDLLAGNCLEGSEKVWLIDYEYSGNNDPCFELGNLWSEATLDLDHLEILIDAYFGHPDPQKIAQARLQGLMSKYGWTLWASIQQGAAAIDFDFWGWGMEKYERALSEFTSADFPKLLDLAGGKNSRGQKT